jgi:hypothetical protein
MEQKHGAAFGSVDEDLEVPPACGAYGEPAALPHAPQYEPGS